MDWLERWHPANARARRALRFIPPCFCNPVGGQQILESNQQYTEGTLIIDFVDSKTHKLVFRGLSQAAVGSTERNAAAVQEAVNKIVATYPG
jgi:hypothetical protein